MKIEPLQYILCCIEFDVALQNINYISVLEIWSFLINSELNFKIML